MLKFSASTGQTVVYNIGKVSTHLLDRLLLLILVSSVPHLPDRLLLKMLVSSVSHPLD